MVLGHLSGFDEQAWIGRGVTGLVLANGLEISRVSHDEAELFKLAEKVFHRLVIPTLRYSEIVE